MDLLSSEQSTEPYVTRTPEKSKDPPYVTRVSPEQYKREAEEETTRELEGLYQYIREFPEVINKTLHLKKDIERHQKFLSQFIYFDPVLHYQLSVPSNWVRALFCLVLKPEILIYHFINPEWLRSEDVDLVSPTFSRALDVVQIGLFFIYVPLILMMLLIGSQTGKTPLPDSSNLFYPGHSWSLSYKFLFFHLLSIPIIPTVIFDLPAHYWSVGLLSVALFLLEKGLYNGLLIVFVTSGLFGIERPLMDLFESTYSVSLPDAIRYVIPVCLLVFLYPLETSEIMMFTITYLVAEYFVDGLKSQHIPKDGLPYTRYFRMWIWFTLGCAVLVPLDIPYFEWVLCVPTCGVLVIFVLLLQITTNREGP